MNICYEMRRMGLRERGCGDPKQGRNSPVCLQVPQKGVLDELMSFFQPGIPPPLLPFPAVQPLPGAFYLWEKISVSRDSVEMLKIWRF